MYIHHTYFMHSSAGGHLGCFHVLAVVNTAAMTTGVHGSLYSLAMRFPLTSKLTDNNFVEFQETGFDNREELDTE